MGFFASELYYWFENFMSIAFDDGLQMLQATSFYDTRPAAERFKICLRMKALSTCIAIIVVSYKLNILLTKRFAINILEASVKKNSQYLLLIIPIFVGLSVVGGFILGPYNSDYAYFQRSLISVSLFSIGRICKFSQVPIAYQVAVGKALGYASLSTSIFIVLIYVLVLFLTFTIFIAFGLQSYYQVISRVGYYENNLY